MNLKSIVVAVQILFASLLFAAPAEKVDFKVVSESSPILSGGEFAKPVKDFIFSAKVLTRDNARAKIFFHTNAELSKGYSVIIDNNPLSSKWWSSTGSLFSVRNIVKKFAKDGEWFDLKIKVHGAEICVWINGLKVVEYIEPITPYRTANNKEMKLSEGSFALKHIGGGNVEFKDIRIQKLPERSDILNQQANAIDENTDKVIKLHQRDFPVLDTHVHLKGGFTADWAFAKSRKIGINYAIAPNCGRDFQLNKANKAEDYIANTAADYPFINCMQAEGREWYKLFPASTRSKFAYVFTDAMTLNDLNGKRTHIWRLDEVDCPKGSEEAYTDLIVKTICNLLENEPADIYANPMRLPEFLEKDFGKYWTAPRKEKILNSLVKGGKVLEINMITRLPDFEFIKAAKARGVKFTFGSNNASPEFGRFQYAYDVIENCALEPSDIFNPYTAKISKTDK